jgi:tetratricopeptide (TPR) repeat protein
MINFGGGHYPIFQGGSMNSYPGSDLNVDEPDEKKNYQRTNTIMTSDISENSRKNRRVMQTSNLAHATEILPSAAGLNIAQNRLSNEFTFSSQSSSPITNAVVICSAQSLLKSKEEDSDDVTKDFIQKFNDHRGNPENVALAQRMLKKNRQLGGIEKNINSPYIDIPSARRNLFLLAGLNHQELKMEALHSLIEILDADPIKRNTAFDLVVLAIDLMKQMDRELMQTQLIEEQILICQAYGIVAELIQRHYAKKHLGGITSELKIQLVNTVRTLEDLNTQGNTHLHFTVEYALEGVKRLRDDRKELFEIAERIFHLLAAVLAFEGDNPSIFASELPKVFQGLDTRITHSWYDSTMLFNELCKPAFNEISQLALLQYLVKAQAKDLDWKYLYNAINKFGKIAIHGFTPSIRKAALMGCKTIGEDYPGISEFIDCKIYPRKTSLKPMIHFKAPVLKDRNLLIRELCVKTLFKIAEKCPDLPCRKNAKQVLLDCLKLEGDQNILKILHERIPKNVTDQTKWLLEKDDFAYQHPLKKNEISLNEPSPDLQNAAKTPFHQLEQISNVVFQNIYLNHPNEMFILDRYQGTINPPTSFGPNFKTPYNSPENILSSPSSSPSQLSRAKEIQSTGNIALQLGNSLNIPPQIIQENIKLGHDIQVNEVHHLQINLEGMKKIIKFMQTGLEISTLDFSTCQIEEDALFLLAESLVELNVNKLNFPTSFSKGSAKKFAGVLKNNRKFLITFHTAEDDLLFGAELKKAGLTSKALEYYEKALKKLKNSDDKKLESKILCHIGQAQLSLGNLTNARNALLKALKMKPESYNATIALAKLYHIQNNATETIEYATMALKLKPSDKTAQELISEAKIPR